MTTLMPSPYSKYVVILSEGRNATAAEGPAEFSLTKTVRTFLPTNSTPSPFRTQPLTSNLEPST